MYCHILYFTTREVASQVSYIRSRDKTSHYRHSSSRQFQLIISVLLFQSDTSQVDKDIRWADAFLVVYSITDKNSFNNAIQLVETIYDGKGTDELHVALVGNKIDLEHFRKGIKKADIIVYEKLITKNLV